MAGTSNNITQTLWDVITCPCPSYMLLATNFSHGSLMSQVYLVVLRGRQQYCLKNEEYMNIVDVPGFTSAVLIIGVRFHWCCIRNISLFIYL